MAMAMAMAMWWRMFDDCHTDFCNWLEYVRGVVRVEPRLCGALEVKSTESDTIYMSSTQ